MAPDDKKVVVSALMLACKPLKHEFYLMAPDVRKAVVTALMLACKPKKQEIAKLLLCQAGMKDS